MFNVYHHTTPPSPLLSTSTYNSLGCRRRFSFKWCFCCCLLYFVSLSHSLTFSFFLFIVFWEYLGRKSVFDNHSIILNIQFLFFFFVMHILESVKFKMSSAHFYLFYLSLSFCGILIKEMPFPSFLLFLNMTNFCLLFLNKECIRKT